MPAPYMEIVLQGKKTDVLALVDDWRKTAGAAGADLFFSADLGLSAEDRIFEILEALHFAEGHTHLLVSAAFLPAFRKKLSETRFSCLAIKAAHEVLEMLFHFSFQCYNREHAEKIKKIIDERTEGVIIEGYEPKERVDPNAAGEELYTPVHEFEFEGGGLARGPVPAIVKMYLEAQKEPLIILEKMRIVLGADLLPSGGELITERTPK
jgi:hypothetical protein